MPISKKSLPSNHLFRLLILTQNIENFFNMQKIKSLFVINILMLSSLAALSQDCFFKLDSIDNADITFDSCWIYHPGDDTAWARLNFPDQQWDTLSPALHMTNIDSSDFPGIGWFRLHLNVDSSLWDKTYVLLIRHKGASEIYHNGNLLKRTGRLGIDSTKHRYIDPQNLPIPIHFGKQQHQVIAVRYANENAEKNFKKYKRESAGFAMEIADISSITTLMVGMSLGVNIVITLFNIFIVLGGLHLLLFLFFPENKANLYYSLFALLFAMIVFSSYLELAVIFRPGFTMAYAHYLDFLSPFIFIPLMALVYNLFYEKTPIIFWIITLLAIGVGILRYLDVSWFSYALGGLIFLIFVEIFRVVIRGMIKKINGVWIIGTGILFFILFLSSLIIVAIWMGSYRIQGNNQYALLISGLMILAVISIPLSMSVFLARDFARTNKDLKLQLENVQVLSAKSIEQEKEKQKILAGQKEKLEVLVKERTSELESEKEKTEELLLNTLPVKVVNELKENGISEPESFEEVTVYFSDIVGFTNISSQLEPALLIKELNEIFTAFDDIMERNHCERIKTIGDAYLAVCGMPDENDSHAYHMARAALEITNYMNRRNENSEINWKIRIGIHSGKVVGGIVGVKKYIYDVFGDTINTTSRMESHSEPMRINVSETTFGLLKDKFSFTPREPMEIKGKGKMRMYFLEG